MFSANSLYIRKPCAIFFYEKVVKWCLKAKKEKEKNTPYNERYGKPFWNPDPVAVWKRKLNMMIGKLKSSFGAVNGKKAIYKIIKRFRYRQPELLYWNEKEKQSHFQEKQFEANRKRIPFKA